jgi:hypothetical protein
MSQPHEHPAHLPKKRTIVKDRIGCVRTSTYNLPGDNHTYGKETVSCDEGAGDCNNYVIIYLFSLIEPFSCRF